MSCRFVSEIETLHEDIQKRPLRLLEITFSKGGKAMIFVTTSPAFSLHTSLGSRINVWHFEVKDNKITLTGMGSDSVDAGSEMHEIITNWPLKETIP